LGLLTADPSLTGEVVSFFHYLTGRSDSPSFERLMVAPRVMRDRLLQKINRETEAGRAGRPARVVAKMNQLEDPAMIAALCDASRAGSADWMYRNLSRRVEVVTPVTGRNLRRKLWEILDAIFASSGRRGTSTRPGPTSARLRARRVRKTTMRTWGRTNC
jgi:polyphosphate kinase